MKYSMRNWHTWGSVALGVPLLLVGLTTFLIAHDKALGTKEIIVPIGVKNMAMPEIRSGARIGGDQWIGTPQGVFRLDGERAVRVEGSPKDEIRGMAGAGSAVLLAGKKALWRLEDGKATQVYKADCWQVSAGVDGYLAACKEVGLLASADGKEWRERTVTFPDQATASTHTGIPLSKLVLDIHTGKIFFGKQYEWIWIDLLGLACVGLGITGLTMWMRSRRQRAGVTR